MGGMPQSPTELVITDPTTLRALAHPARRRVLMELYSGEVLTASQAAELCDLSPSAMSYHLRALERAGIVARAESTDGRERPWRGVARSLTIDHSALSGAGLAGSQAYLQSWSADLLDGLQRLVANVVAGDQRGQATSGRLWLTDDEELAMAQEIRSVWERYSDRTRQDRPEGARLRDTYFLALPRDDAG